MSYTEISASHPKGRKEYQCSWCNTNIEKGEKHFSRAYHWEGDFQTDRMHLECETAMMSSPYDLISEGFSPGEQKRGEILS